MWLFFMEWLLSKFVTNENNEKCFLLDFSKSENVGNIKVINLKLKYVKDFSLEFVLWVN